MNEHSQRIVAIIDAETLSDCAAELHDGHFSAQELSYDARSGRFTLSVWQDAVEESQFCRKWRWLYTKVVPLRKYIAIFDRVTSCDIVATEQHDYYVLGAIEYLAASRRIELIPHYGMTITLEVDQLSGELLVTDKLRTDWAMQRIVFSFKDLESTGPRR